MERKIIKIDRDKCNGCGLCVDACHEGAIGMQDGKATLLRDDYCDGLGDCLPVCPVNAITFETRDALAYDEAAVKKNMESKNNVQPFTGCPGKRAAKIERESVETELQVKTEESMPKTKMKSRLSQWPVQIKLVPINAEYFDDANLLIAADCSAYAYANFHEEFIKNHITIIGCPKLDEGEYSDKLTAILKNNNIKSVKIVRMEVPCCGGIYSAAVNALKNCGKMIPWSSVVISLDGEILEN